MNLQNQEVLRGDKVYDLLEGEGTVIRTNNKQIAVDFGNNISYVYSSKGQRIGNTPDRFPILLFWQNPVVMYPVKGDKKWEAMQAMFLNTYKIIKEL